MGYKCEIRLTTGELLQIKLLKVETTDKFLSFISPNNSILVVNKDNLKYYKVWNQGA